jgi:hypothetical protein
MRNRQLDSSYLFDGISLMLHRRVGTIKASTWVDNKKGRMREEGKTHPCPLLFFVHAYTEPTFLT